MSCASSPMARAACGWCGHWRSRPTRTGSSNIATSTWTIYASTRRRHCDVRPDPRPVQPSTVLALSRTLRAGSAGAAACAAASLTAAARGALPEARSGHPVIAGAGACSISASVVTNRSTNMKAQQQYVGLDVSLEQTSICVVDDAGATIWRGKCRSTPESIHAVIAKHAPKAARIGLETGQLSTWLFHELRARQLPVICIDARHAKAAL